MPVDHEPWTIPLEPDPLDTLYNPGQSYYPPSRATDNSALEPPTQFGAALWDGLMWIGGAIALRLAINSLLTYSTHFWIPSIMILALPAVVAIAITTVKPELSWIVGYRLILLMVGLLLGGRL